MTNPNTSTTYNVKSYNVCNTQHKVTGEIKVKICLPEDMREHTRQQKINRIYDILTPENS